MEESFGRFFQDATGILGTEALEELWQKVAPCLNGRKLTFDLPGRSVGFARATLVPLNQGVHNIILCRANGRHETLSLSAKGQLSGLKLLGAVTHDAVRRAVIRGLATALGVAN